MHLWGLLSFGVVTFFFSMNGKEDVDSGARPFNSEVFLMEVCKFMVLKIRSLYSDSLKFCRHFITVNIVIYFLDLCVFFFL